ncbi:MAG: hypothetical protein R2751_01200 [Bacteroidales bacterium]
MNQDHPPLPQAAELTRKQIRALKRRGRNYLWAHPLDALRIARLRKCYEGIQLKTAELIRIAHAIEEREGCHMLVFGMGNDSPFWEEINKKGRTVFLEDFQPWFNKISHRFPDIEAYPIAYPCNITQWEEGLDHPPMLALDLPPEVAERTWDVILVDGPRGHQFRDDIPGRMSSIYMASTLVAPGGMVFVHDAERRIEERYADRFLGRDRLAYLIRGRAHLKAYRF